MTIKHLNEGSGISKRIRVSVSGSGKEEQQAIENILNTASSESDFESVISDREKWAHDILEKLWLNDKSEVERQLIPIPEDCPYLALMHLKYKHDSREGYAQRIITHLQVIRKSISENDVGKVALFTMELGAIIQQCADKYQLKQKKSASQNRTSALNNLILEIIKEDNVLSANKIYRAIERRFKERHESTKFIQSIDLINEQKICTWFDRKGTKKTALDDKNFESRISKVKNK